MLNLQILSKELIYRQNLKISRKRIRLNIVLPKYIVIGIDPGSKNLGISITCPTDNVIETNQISIKRSPDPIQRIQAMFDIASLCCESLENQIQPLMVVEGASYGNAFGQVDLEQARSSLVIWGMQNNCRVMIASPKSIRKTVFGSGIIKAHEVWKELKPDEAASLSCCLYGIF